MNKALLIGSLVLAVAGACFGSAEFKATYFTPSDSNFKSIYGSGPQFGFDGSFPIATSVDLWIGVDYFYKKGKTSFTQEETKLTLVPVEAGVRYRFLPGQTLSPYVAAGVEYVLYVEESKPLGKVTSGGVGFLGKAGFLVSFLKWMGLDVGVGYSYCSWTPADFKINVGGLEITAGLYF
jgi:opacity protein-like surface antigen